MKSETDPKQSWQASPQWGLFGARRGLMQYHVDTLRRLTEHLPEWEQTAVKKTEYVLGHSAFELERLARQERLIGPITRDLGL
jgi:hypothetical protein